MPNTVNKRPRLNESLYRAHRALLFFYGFFFFGIMFAVVYDMINKHSSTPAEGLVGCLVLAIPCAAHYYAMTAAAKGSPVGRGFSQIIGVVMLLGIPIGTAIGGYILYQTGKKWQGAGSDYVIENDKSAA